MPRHGVTWNKFRPCEEIADLLTETVLQGQTHQAGDYVVETRSIRGAVRTFHTKKEFCRLFVIVDTEVARALAGNSDLLCDMIAAGRQGTTRNGLPYNRGQAVSVTCCKSLSLIGRLRGVILLIYFKSVGAFKARALSHRL